MKEVDLRGLIEDGVPEGRAIEYKLELPGPTDSEKKEFLADVSSFANTNGGTMYFGISEDKGIPTKLVGLSVSSVDEEIQRLENLLRNGLEPRLPVTRIFDVPLAESRVVLVLEIPRSWALPHRVSLKGHDKFYARNAAGKYPVDVTELRALFSQSETLVDRLKRFRHERLATIRAGESPLGSNALGKLVLHLIPLQSFEPGRFLDLSSLQQDFELKPLYARGSSTSCRHNFDGVLKTATSPPVGTYGYLQIFRNGILETVDTGLLSVRDGKKYIPSVTFERELGETVKKYLRSQSAIGVQPPVYVALSLMGVQGYYMSVNEARYYRSDFSDAGIDRDELVLPEIAATDPAVNPFELLKPIFDIVWNAAGWPESHNYSNGEWKVE